MKKEQNIHEELQELGATKLTALKASVNRPILSSIELEKITQRAMTAPATAVVRPLAACLRWVAAVAAVAVLGVLGVMMESTPTTIAATPDLEAIPTEAIAAYVEANLDDFELSLWSEVIASDTEATNLDTDWSMDAVEEFLEEDNYWLLEEQDVF